MTRPDEPSVMGGHQAPMATEGEFKAAFKRAFVAHMMKVAEVPLDVAENEFDCSPWDDIKDLGPELAAETAMEVWDVE